MSIEDFQAKFPIEPNELKATVNKLKKESDSSVSALARSLVYDASSELRSLMSIFGESDAPIEPDGEMFMKMPQEIRESLKLHYAAVICGLVVIELEQALVSRMFDFGSFMRQFNVAISGTKLRTFSMPENPILPLSKEEMGLMYTTVNKDKTFMSFFDNDAECIPAIARSFITTIGVLPTIQTGVVPIFKERAKLLI